MVSFLTACQDEDPAVTTDQSTASYDNEVVIKWNDLILEVERYTPGYLPPVAARSLAYIGLAAYETAIPGMPDHKSLGDYYAGLDLPAANDPHLQEGHKTDQKDADILHGRQDRKWTMYRQHQQ